MEESFDRSPDLWLTERYHGNTGMTYKVKNILFSEKSDFQHVCIAETEALGRVLLNDGMFMVSERDEFVYHEMIAHVPLFAHPNPENVLIIGGGDGGTAREVLRHQGVRRCVMVEIDEMVVKACKAHLPSVSCALDDPRLVLKIDDGVRFVAESQETFDVVLIDSTDPVGPATPLFGKTFYQNVLARLSPCGIVVSQSESPFYDLDVQKSLFSILREVFSNVYIYTIHNLTYPGGLWSFSFASPQTDPFSRYSPERVKASGLSFKYYNEQMQRGAFMVPTFMMENLKGLVSSPFEKP